MNRNEAVAMIQEQLGFRTDLNNTIINHLNRAQTTLELRPRLPWFLKSELSTALTTANEQRLPIPTDMLREDDDGALWLILQEGDERPVPLFKEDLDHLRHFYLDGIGLPRAYALDGQYFRLFPTPDAIYTIQLNYFRKAEALTLGTSQNEWLKYAPLLLIGRAGFTLASALRDTSAKQTFLEWETRASHELDIADEARDDVNRNMQMGGPV